MERPVAFITGASGGIGVALAERLAREGYSLILHYNKNVAQIMDLKEKLEEKYNSSCTIFQADFSNPVETIAKVEEHVSKYEPEVIVHNSGTSYVGLFTSMSDVDLTWELTVGLTTPLLITKHLLPSMIRKQRGKIIVISSIWGLTGASCEVVYSTIKGGLNTFVKSLAKEVAPSKIQVNGVAPGAIQTSMLNHLDKEEIDSLKVDIPAGYLGSPSDVAATVAFLISEESRYINGQIISVNGAWYC